MLNKAIAPTIDYEATHLDGGNLFDDMRININESHLSLDKVPRETTSFSQSRLGNKFRYLRDGFFQKFGLHTLLLNNEIKRKWFYEFMAYWSNALNGRPLTVSDFTMLLHDYRKKQQFVDTLEWNDPEQHIYNWQNPSQLYSTIHYARKLALNPIAGRQLWPRVKKKSRILEYGCSLAPFFNSYRHYYSHLDCKWLLADIPNFPFHYTKYSHRQRDDVEFATIYPEKFKDPLEDQNSFDIVLLTTVLEHLDEPTFVTNYLIDRIKVGGLFVFDYVKSDAHGLDTPAGLMQREQCLKQILNRCDIISGKVDISKNVQLCIGRVTGKPASTGP